MGILNEELQDITNQYLEETDENVELELGKFSEDNWTIDNKEMAMKVDYLLHKLEEKIQEDEAIAKSQKEPLQSKIDKLEEGKLKIDEWLDRSTKTSRTTIENLKNHLILFHQRTIDAEELVNEQRVKDGKKPLKISKSIKLTYRDMTSKVKQPEIVKDDNELIKWVENNYAGGVHLSEIQELIEMKINNKDEYVRLEELDALISSINPDLIKREKKLAWGDFKKTLIKNTIETKAVDAKGNEYVVETKLIYVDSDGQEVPVGLIEQGVDFGWKLNE